MARLLGLFSALVCLLPISAFSQADSTSFNTRQHADSILAGTCHPMDDDATFACMDSLLSDNPETRNYYFGVMRVITKKSDGALSEMVGIKLQQYLDTFPIEFVDNYKLLDSNEQKQFINFIAWEYSMNAENKKAALINAYNDFLTIYGDYLFTDAIDFQLIEKEKIFNEIKDSVLKTIEEMDE